MVERAASRPPADPAGGTGSFSGRDASWVPLLDRAARLGQLVWMERRLFERFGVWAGTCDHDALVVAYGESSRRHGWHAQVLHERLPELSVLDPEALVVAPGPATVELVDHLATLDEAQDALRWWVSHRVVLPLLVTTLREERATVDPTAEPALDRWLRILVDDDVEELLDGDALARRVAPDPADAVLDAQRRAEALALRCDLLRR